MADGPVNVTSPGKSKLKGVVQRPPWRLRLRLQDRDGTPLAYAPYQLALTGARKPKHGEIPLQTDGNGNIDAALPPDCKDGVLTVGGRTFTLRIGLGPSATTGVGLRGVKARLRNLGYTIPSIDSKKDRALQVALAAFQADYSLGDPDGEPSEATLEKLKEVHGC